MRHMCTMAFQVVGGSLLPEAVTWLFTSVLRGLQIHGQHETCNATLSYLAMLIYDNLVSLASTTADDSWTFYSYRYFYRDTILFLKCCWNHFINVVFFFRSELCIHAPSLFCDSGLATWSSEQLWLKYQISARRLWTSMTAGLSTPMPRKLERKGGRTSSRSSSQELLR